MNDTWTFWKKKKQKQKQCLEKLLFYMENKICEKFFPTWKEKSLSMQYDKIKNKTFLKNGNNWHT